MGEPDTAALRRDETALDWLNFCLADVKDGLGPFLAIFLLSGKHWDPGSIGIVLTIGGLATVLARGPAGALVDAIIWKRSLIAMAAGAVSIATIAMALAPDFWPVALAQAVSGIADAIFPVAIAAISLGIFGRNRLTHRIGRNEAFNHAGNVATAAVAGIAGYVFSPSAVLWVIAVLAAASIAATFRIDGTSIDHRLARGADDGDHGKTESNAFKVLIRNRPLLLFTIAITLFHFANAAMLPLVGEELAKTNQNAGSLFIASCIIVAQIVMVPMAILVGRKADQWGRKRLFLAGFAVLPIRGLLYTLVHDPAALIAIQILDGIGAGIFGALFFIVVADLTKGSGHYNLAQGASGACWGFGAALSNTVAGQIVNMFDYSAAFLFLTLCAVIALIVFWFGVPETLGWAPAETPDRRSAEVTADA
jgi:MFS family permease